MSVWQDCREMVKEQVTYRDLLYQMTKRDLLLRYKQTVLGFGWAIFMPLVNTAVFSVVFMRVAKIDVGMPYPLFAFTGLLTWNFFASSLKFAIVSLTSNSQLVSKVYFPREIFPFSSVIVCLIDFAVASILVIGMMIWYRIPITPMILLLPVVLAVHILFTLGMALLISMGNLFFRDVKYLFEIFLTVWMFGTSVLFPVSLVGGKLGVVMQLNPMTPIIDGYRAVLFQGQSPFTPPFALAVAISVVIFGVSWLTFHRAEFQFAENI
jgi:ABC-type polysaccharide/polyol phosphate export permease